MTRIKELCDHMGMDKLAQKRDVFLVLTPFYLKPKKLKIKKWKLAV